jgi:ferric-dicitrate binding protein FerR (iron transport regulator)
MHHIIKKTLNKGKSEFASESEKRDMLKLFHETENEYQLKEILFNELVNSEAEEASSQFLKKLFTRLWSKIEKKKGQEQKSTVRLIIPLGRIAGAVLFGLVIGIYTSSLKTFKKPVYYETNTPKGSVSEMVLPDSSLIILNGGSTIKYSYNGQKGIREVFLNGEAWFDVHKNRKKPFVVHTACYDVIVTGTRFNIKSYASDKSFTTTLEEGEVVINGTEKFKLAESITLVPGEQFVFDRDIKEVNIKKININQVTSWKDNKLIFVNTSMKEAIVLLERKYGVDIEVNNSEILDLHVYATFEDETIIELLEYLKDLLHINYQIFDQKILITTTN